MAITHGRVQTIIDNVQNKFQNHMTLSFLSNGASLVPSEKLLLQFLKKDGVR